MGKAKESAKAKEAVNDMLYNVAVGIYAERMCKAKGLDLGKKVKFTQKAVEHFAKDFSKWHPARPEINATVRGVIVGFDLPMACAIVEWDGVPDKTWALDWLEPA